MSYIFHPFRAVFLDIVLSGSVNYPYLFYDALSGYKYATLILALLCHSGHGKYNPKKALYFNKGP